MNEKNYAGFWIRVLAALIDMLILWIPCMIFKWSFESYFSPMTFAVIDFIQITFIWALYYGFMESSQKAGTFGKQILGLRVYDINGKQLSFNRAAARFLMSIVVSIPLGIGLFMVGWTAKKQGWHDIVCKCLVFRGFAS